MVADSVLMYEIQRLLRNSFQLKTDQFGLLRELLQLLSC